MLSSKRLIKMVRARSNNEDWGPDSGISDETIVSYLNEGKAHIQSAILNVHPNTLNREIILDLVEGQESYPLPSDVFDAGGIVSVERRLFGVERWVQLEQGGPIDRSGGFRGIPRMYIRDNNSILLRPLPSLGSGGALRVTYKASFNNLGVAYTTVSSTDLPNNTITIDVSADPDDADALDRLDILIEAINSADYLSLTDKKGNLVVRDLLIVDFDPDTGVVEFAEMTFDGDAADLIGLQVVVGANASTRILEPIPASSLILHYLVDFAVKEIIASDSSADIQEKILKLEATERKIVESYANFSDDFISIQDTGRYY